MNEDTTLTAEEVKQLLGESEEITDAEEEARKEFTKATTIDTGASKILCPVVLHTTDGHTFETNGLNTCTYTQVGLYLSVYKAGETAENARHYVIPWQQVSHCELKFDQMVELAAELEKDEGSGD